MTPIEASLTVTVCSNDIDEFGHVNHAVYLRYLDELAWVQLGVVGLGKLDLRRMNRALIVRRHVIQFSRPSFLGDRLIATGQLIHAGKCSLVGTCVMTQESTGLLVVTIDTEWVWLDTERNLPAELPPSLA
jgi:acyl-CoA thioester hydrolase